MLQVLMKQTSFKYAYAHVFVFVYVHVVCREDLSGLQHVLGGFAGGVCLADFCDRCYRVAWSVCLSHSSSQRKPLNGMRCHLAGTVTFVWPPGRM